jgi:hypothetical protein
MARRPTAALPANGRSALPGRAADRKAGYYTKFIDGEFLRATAKDRAEYNKVALGGAGAPGWATINDVRDWGRHGRVRGRDHIYAPVNAGPIGPDGIPKVGPDTADQARRRDDGRLACRLVQNAKQS